MFRPKATTMRTGTVSAISEDGKIGNVNFDDNGCAMFFTDHGRFMKPGRRPFFDNNCKIETPIIGQRLACEWTGTAVRRWTLLENYQDCLSKKFAGRS